MSTREMMCTNKTALSGFEAASEEADPYRQCGPFERDFQKRQERQLKVFTELERGLTIREVSAFRERVHFQDSHRVPVQRWYPYREGYSISLVNTFLEELNVTGVTFDPFAGTGTTLLASRMKDLQSFGVDVNPLSVLVCKVENEQYDQADLQLFVRELDQFKGLEISKKDFHTSFYLADKVFNRDILHALLTFKHHIKTIENEKIRNLLYVAWLSVIEDVSNIKKEGNGIKYKNRKRTPSGYIDIDKEIWERKTFPDNKFDFVKNKILRRLEIILDDVKYSYGSSVRKPRVFNGDCLEFDRFFQDEIEFTFFSPPYCNCFDYFEIHKVELWLGDFVTSQSNLRILRNQGFRSNTNALDRKTIRYRNGHVENLISLFDTENLWNKKIPNVVRGYFDDFHALLLRLYRQTARNGSVGIVVGNSAYSGIIIPTDILISEIAREVGFGIKSLSVARHLTTSSQQKKKLEKLNNYLRESIVLLQK